jgi:tRNA A37 threonylcarbamoyladenosine biosynthesis protein TsaE
MNPIPLHNDEPTLLDLLERRALLARVGDAVATCEPPYVFGIHGDWGAGKTSFLHQLQLYLTGCPASCIWSTVWSTISLDC